MIGEPFCNAVELFYFKMIVGEYIIDPERGRQAGKSAADPKPFFQKSILHFSPYCKIRIGIRYIVQITAKNDRIWAVINDLPYNAGLDAAI